MNKQRNGSSNGAVLEADREAPMALSIKPLNIERIQFRLVGTAPLVQCRFSKKGELMGRMAEGQAAKKGRAKAARDFDKDFRDAMHLSADGWCGVPASAIRNASIDVCRMVGFKMTHARMSIFVEPDGFDAEEGVPLVRIVGPDPERYEAAVRNATGVIDIRVRPMWRQWEIRPVVTYDADQFTANDVLNLIARAGVQVGIGEGRPFSKSSNGQGFGTFKVEN